MARKSKRTKIKEDFTNKLFRFSNLIVLLVIMLNIWFTVKVFAVFELVGSEPQTLIVSWFAFTVGELYMLKSIKNTKTKSNIKCSDKEEE